MGTEASSIHAQSIGFPDLAGTQDRLIGNPAADAEGDPVNCHRRLVSKIHPCSVEPSQLKPSLAKGSGGAGACSRSTNGGAFSGLP